MTSKDTGRKYKYCLDSIVEDPRIGHLEDVMERGGGVKYNAVRFKSGEEQQFKSYEGVMKAYVGVCNDSGLNVNYGALVNFVKRNKYLGKNLDIQSKLLDYLDSQKSLGCRREGNFIGDEDVGVDEEYGKNVEIESVCKGGNVNVGITDNMKEKKDGYYDFVSPMSVGRDVVPRASGLREGGARERLSEYFGNRVRTGIKILGGVAVGVGLACSIGMSSGYGKDSSRAVDESGAGYDGVEVSRSVEGESLVDKDSVDKRVDMADKITMESEESGLESGGLFGDLEAKVMSLSPDKMKIKHMSPDKMKIKHSGGVFENRCVVPEKGINAFLDSPEGVTLYNEKPCSLNIADRMAEVKAPVVRAKGVRIKNMKEMGESGFSFADEFYGKYLEHVNRESPVINEKWEVDSPASEEFGRRLSDVLHVNYERFEKVFEEGDFGYGNSRKRVEDMGKSFSNIFKEVGNFATLGRKYTPTHLEGKGANEFLTATGAPTRVVGHVVDSTLGVSDVVTGGVAKRIYTGVGEFLKGTFVGLPLILTTATVGAVTYPVQELEKKVYGDSYFSKLINGVVGTSTRFVDNVVNMDAMYNSDLDSSGKSKGCVGTFAEQTAVYGLIAETYEKDRKKRNKDKKSAERQKSGVKEEGSGGGNGYVGEPHEGVPDVVNPIEHGNIAEIPAAVKPIVKVPSSHVGVPLVTSSVKRAPVLPAILAVN